MNMKFTGVGADPKKLAALGGCVIIAAYLYFSNSSPSGPSGSSASSPASAVVPGAPQPLGKMPTRAARNKGFQRGGSFLEFHPSLKPPKDLDRASIDPTLRLDLLEKLQNVKPEQGGRSLFEIGPTQAQAAAATLAKGVPEPAKIAIKRNFTTGPNPPQPPPKPVEPAAPPIPLKFYGFINPKSAGVKRAFFLDGDDIIVANEGQLVKNRYRVVRIGINSAVVEDTQFKKNSEQTLPLVKEQEG